MILRPHHMAKLGAAWMPFADAASDGLPLGQLYRLALFQLSVGMAQVLMLGTLNRVMIVELHVPATLVALMIAIPVLVAPFRALIGHRSDHHRSAIGWKRVPYLWFGSLWQMGGLAVMPFALIVLSGDQTHGPASAGPALAAMAFLMTGLGMHMTQTAGLALASDRATDETRPRVVAALYVMYLVGMGISALVVGYLLRDFAPLTLVRVVQGCALATLILNIIALWKQEKVRPMTRAERAEPLSGQGADDQRYPDARPRHLCAADQLPHRPQGHRASAHHARPPAWLGRDRSPCDGALAALGAMCAVSGRCLRRGTLPEARAALSAICLQVQWRIG